MIKIAIIDDNIDDIKSLKNCLLDFINEKKDLSLKFDVIEFTDPKAFLSSEIKNYNLIFLDIEMPSINGLDLAKKIREKNDSVALVFITNMAQYALNGYEVNAIDFMVKPLNYFDFSLKFKKIIKYIERNYDYSLTIKNGENDLIRFNTNEIIYVEIFSHYLLFHLKDNVIKVRGTMNDIEEKLSAFSFVRIAKSFLINLKYIKNIKGEKVILSDDTELSISRLRKTEFMNKFYKYIGGGLN